ncbi:MAG: lipoate--protein ligase family protein [Limisphaerales bacterium]
MTSWYLIDSGTGDAAFNMALDEALLEAAARLSRPALRFYGWTTPAASFGYFQKFSSVKGATLPRTLVRRPTGGGIVPHETDWTYSFTAPPGHEWHSLSAVDSYRRIHEWIGRAFARLDIPTSLAPDKKPAGPKDPPGECFIGHEKFDLLWQGKKIAGAAQRRNKLGLLIQGSVQPQSAPFKRDHWQEAMRAAGSEMFSIGWTDFLPDELLLARAAELARRKYATADYSGRR